MKNNSKGITLIALVITIIVLLILAGVSIAMLTGDNGLLTKATESKTSTAKSEVAERVNMELNAQMTNAMSENKFDSKNSIENSLGLTSGKIGDYTITVTVTDSTENPGKYGIDAKVEIAISGSTATNDFNPSTGKVEYNSTSKKWEITPIKVKN